MPIDLIREIIRIHPPETTRFEEELRMLVPYPLPLRRKLLKDGRPAWDDPVRMLYPNHEEFWPEPVPEHVLLQQKSRELARRLRRRRLRKLLRLVFNLRGREKPGEKDCQEVCQQEVCQAEDAQLATRHDRAA
ncbi:hypothetical protein ACFFVJ_14725 [Roseibium salinum]